MKTLLPKRMLGILLVLLSFYACKQFSGNSEAAPVEEVAPESTRPERCFRRLKEPFGTVMTRLKR